MSPFSDISNCRLSTTFYQRRHLTTIPNVAVLRHSLLFPPESTAPQMYLDVTTPVPENARVPRTLQSNNRPLPVRDFVLHGLGSFAATGISRSGLSKPCGTVWSSKTLQNAEFAPVTPVFPTHPKITVLNSFVSHTSVNKGLEVLCFPHIQKHRGCPPHPNIRSAFTSNTGHEPPITGHLSGDHESSATHSVSRHISAARPPSVAAPMPQCHNSNFRPASASGTRNTGHGPRATPPGGLHGIA
jgi:hypothetical protein